MYIDNITLCITCMTVPLHSVHISIPRCHNKISFLIYSREQVSVRKNFSPFAHLCLMRRE